MNKVIILLTCMFILTFITGCSIGEISKTDKEIMNDIMDDILKYIEKEDYEGIKSLFSDRALEERDNFDKDIEYIFHFFEGELVKSEIYSGPAVHEERENGKTRKQIDTIFRIETTKEVYIIYLFYYDKDEEKSKNEGIYAMRVVLESNEDKWNINRMDMRYPGIYNPERDE